MLRLAARIEVDCRNLYGYTEPGRRPKRLKGAGCRLRFSREGNMRRDGHPVPWLGSFAIGCAMAVGSAALILRGYAGSTPKLGGGGSVATGSGGGWEAT